MYAKVYEKLFFYMEITFLYKKQQRRYTSLKHIILASASPRRKEILELADLDFDIMPSDAEEITTKTEPHEVVMELASIKARDIYDQINRVWSLGLIQL